MTSNDVMEMFKSINKLIYERAAYLKCFKEESMLNFLNEEKAKATVTVGSANLINNSNPSSGIKKYFFINF